MEIIKLPPRLALLASLVPQGARVADVGTDHGLLPVWLLENGIAAGAVATDIRSGPLSRAEALRRERGLPSMRCALCDGLEGISDAEVDTVIIAGMGGENIAGILQRAPWTAQGKLLLLQPMSRPEELRRALKELGLRIEAEYLVEDTGRIYPVIVARGGAPLERSEAEEYTGAYELVSGEALFPEMLSRREKRIEDILSGLEQSGKEEDAARREQLLRVREELRAMRRK